MGPTLSPETSAFKLQTPGKFPEEYKLQNVTLIIGSATCTESVVSSWNILASLGLWWLQHIIVRCLYQHGIEAEVIGSGKTIFVLRIQLRQSDPTVPFKLCRGLNVLHYIHHRLFFQWPAVWGIYSSLFIWQRRRRNYRRASTTYRKR